jgi:hypothetical protein
MTEHCFGGKSLRVGDETRPAAESKRLVPNSVRRRRPHRRLSSFVAAPLAVPAATLIESGDERQVSRVALQHRLEQPDEDEQG